MRRRERSPAPRPSESWRAGWPCSSAGPSTASSRCGSASSGPPLRTGRGVDRSSPVRAPRSRVRDRLAHRPLRARCAGQRHSPHRGRAARVARHAVEGAPAREVRRRGPRHRRRLLARPGGSLDGADGRLRSPGRGRGHRPARRSGDRSSWWPAARARGWPRCSMRRSRLFIFTLEELRRPLSVATYSGTLVAVICSVMVARGLRPASGVRGAGLSAAPPRVLSPGVAHRRRGRPARRGVQPRPARPTPGLPPDSSGARLGAARVVLSAVGLVAWWLPDAVGGGHSVAQRLLSDEYPRGVGVLLVLLAAKLAVTVASYASGSPGGIFAPILVLGTITGVIVGHVGAWFLRGGADSHGLRRPRHGGALHRLRPRAAHRDHADPRDDRRAGPAVRPLRGLPRRVPGRRGPARSPDLRGPARRRPGAAPRVANRVLEGAAPDSPYSERAGRAPGRSRRASVRWRRRP